jgi:hypothetical protein
VSLAPEVSVLLPVRDAVGTLAEALDSTLASEGVRFEMMRVDDGSTDGSAALLDAYARMDAHVRVLHRPSRGIVAALNEALEQTRAPLRPSLAPRPALRPRSHGARESPLPPEACRSARWSARRRSRRAPGGRTSRPGARRPRS